MGAEESYNNPQRPARSSIHKHASHAQTGHTSFPTQLMSLPPVIPNIPSLTSQHS